MTPDLVFRLANAAAVSLWVLLLFAPGWVVTKKVVRSGLGSAALSVLYVACLVVAGPGPEGGGFGTLQKVSVLFDSPWVLCAGWVHYLAFDLLIGAFIKEEADRAHVHHLWIVPILLCTFWVGPVGFLLHCVFVRPRLPPPGHV